MVEHKGAVGTNGHCWTGRLLESGKDTMGAGQRWKTGRQTMRGPWIGKQAPKAEGCDSREPENRLIDDSMIYDSKVPFR